MAAQLPRCSGAVQNRAGRQPSPALFPRVTPPTASQHLIPSCSGRGAEERTQPARLGVSTRSTTRSAGVACRSSLGVFSGGEIVEVAELKGIRVVPAEENQRPTVEYLVKWKDGSPDTW